MSVSQVSCLSCASLYENIIKKLITLLFDHLSLLLLQHTERKTVHLPEVGIFVMVTLMCL